MKPHVLAAAVLIVALAAVAAAIAGSPPALTSAEIERALQLARGREADRQKFHQDYLIATAEPTVTSLDVVTEFRRLVLIAEEKIATGAWSYIVNQRQAQAAMQPWTGKLTVRVRLRFPPMKVYPVAPEVLVEIGDAPRAVQPLKIDSRPEFAIASKGKNQPMTGVAVEAIFDAAAVPRQREPVIVHAPDKLTLRGSVDFAALR